MNVDAASKVPLFHLLTIASFDGPTSRVANAPLHILKIWLSKRGDKTKRSVGPRSGSSGLGDKHSRATSSLQRAARPLWGKCECSCGTRRPCTDPRSEAVRLLDQPSRSTAGAADTKVGTLFTRRARRASRTMM